MTDAPDGIADRLRQAGLRVTQPRRTLLAWLDAHPGHHPAERLVERTGLSRATTYHALGQLCEAGLVLTAGSGTGRLRYETATDPHHHFECRRCERVIDVQADTPDVRVGEPTAVIERVEVIVRGLCADCG